MTAIGFLIGFVSGLFGALGLWWVLEVKTRPATVKVPRTCEHEDRRG